MKEKIIKKEKTIEVDVAVYISDDGKIFENKKECLEYEAEQMETVVKELRIDKLNNILPLNTNGFPNENSSYSWYVVKNLKDIENIEKYYQAKDKDIVMPTTIKKNVSVGSAEIICVEDDGWTDVYIYSLFSIMGEAKEFFDKFGIICAYGFKEAGIYETLIN